MQEEKTHAVIRKNDVTVKDDYQTYANKRPLTPEEERLLEVLLNPEHVGKNVTQKCLAANICRASYYEIMRRERFLDCLNKTAVDLVRDKMAEVIATSVKVATGSGARGFQDRQMLLKMFGFEFQENVDVKIKVINAGEDD